VSPEGVPGQRRSKRSRRRRSRGADRRGGGAHAPMAHGPSTVPPRPAVGVPPRRHPHIPCSWGPPGSVAEQQPPPPRLVPRRSTVGWRIRYHWPQATLTEGLRSRSGAVSRCKLQGQDCRVQFAGYTYLQGGGRVSKTTEPWMPPLPGAALCWGTPSLWLAGPVLVRALPRVVAAGVSKKMSSRTPGPALACS